MKLKKESLVIAVIIIAVIVIPLAVAIGTSADILNWAVNDNDWIGFWGGYFGTLVGSGVTLYVLFKSLADSKKTLEKTLENERYINECNEITMFSQVLIEKSATLSIDIEDMIHKAQHYVILGGRASRAEEYESFLKKMRIVRSVLFEIGMHLEIVNGKDAYSADAKKKLVGTVDDLIDIIAEYNLKINEDEIDKDMERRMIGLRVDLLNQTQDYLKEIKK